jgi:hypothetical protein
MSAEQNWLDIYTRPRHRNGKVCVETELSYAGCGAIIYIVICHSYPIHVASTVSRAERFVNHHQAAWGFDKDDYRIIHRTIDSTTK